MKTTSQTIYHNNGDFSIIPDFINEKNILHNTMWGSEYIVLITGKPSDSIIETVIEGMVMQRAINQFR